VKPETDILPIGPLMIEHRLIERVVTLLEKELARIREGNQVNAFFLTSAIDFFKVYADRCHHGKEEDIFFDDLQKKMLSPEDKTMIENLKQDHVRSRELVGKLAGDVQESSRQPNAEISKTIAADIEDLVKLYKVHIGKEDKEFFIPVMKYLSKEEQDGMLCRFWEFDRLLIHEKYKNIVAQFEA